MRVNGVLVCTEDSMWTLTVPCSLWLSALGSTWTILSRFLPVKVFWWTKTGLLTATFSMELRTQTPELQFKSNQGEIFSRDPQLGWVYRFVQPTPQFQLDYKPQQCKRPHMRIYWYAPCLRIHHHHHHQPGMQKATTRWRRSSYCWKRRNIFVTLQ